MPTVYSAVGRLDHVNCRRIRKGKLMKGGPPSGTRLGYVFTKVDNAPCVARVVHLVLSRQQSRVSELEAEPIYQRGCKHLLS